MIEEYERKINKTKQLLEEEKLKVINKGKNEDTLVQEQVISNSTIESNAKSTPDFKSKKEMKIIENSSLHDNINIGSNNLSAKNAKK